MKQAATRKNDFNPKLVIVRGLLPEMWKFPYSETRSALARLIFLFALASKKLCSKREVSQPVLKEEDDYYPQDSDYECGGDFTGYQSDKADSDWSNALSPSQSDEDYKPLKELKSKKNLRKRKLLGSESGPAPKKRGRTRKRTKNNHYPNEKFQLGSLKKHPVRRPLPARYQHHVPNSTCKICNDDLETLINLETHMISLHESLHETTHQCWFCPKRFSLPETLLAHRWNEHGMFKCDETNCKQAFPSFDEHEQHLQSHIPTGSDPSKAIYHCPKCNLGFLNSTLVGYHELVHLERVLPPNMAGEGEFPCPKCNKYYKNKRHLSSHYRENHFDSKLRKKPPLHQNKGSKNLVPCDNGNCTFSTTSIYFLQQHIRQMHPDAHNCQECGLVFKTNRAKLTHLKEVHQIQSKEYPCPHCDANFVVSSSLQNHIRNVHCERLFVCDICGKACKKGTHLVEHKEYHHNPNRTKHICSTCGKGYWSPSGLLYHMKSIHVAEEDKRFGCPYCPRRYNREGVAKMHVKTCMKQRGMEVSDDLDAIEVEWSPAAVAHVVKFGRRGKPKQRGDRAGIKSN